MNWANGEVVGSETVSLEGGESGTVEFIFEPDESGEYELAIDDETTTLTVEDGLPWWIWLIVLIAIPLLFLLWKRRGDEEDEETEFDGSDPIK